MTVLVAKKIACQLRALEWESVVVDFSLLNMADTIFTSEKSQRIIGNSLYQMI